jgi:3-hydroxyisobutyrate dehydrogenase-like beta-hydroxyacid dehydrogenase
VSAVGFIGLGRIGAPMATHLLGRAGGLVVYDVRSEATEPFAAKGATVASSAGEVAELCEIVSIMVRDDDEVRGVLSEMKENLKPRDVVAVHSTIRPGTASRLEEHMPDGVSIVDAPVSGGPMGAAQGTLVALVGGETEAVERCREVFSAWAGLILHVGPIGSGTHAKLARNLLTFVSYAAAGEAQRLAQAAGIDLRHLATAVRHSDAVTGGPGAIMLRETTVPMKAGDPLREILAHASALGEKDLALAIELAGELGVDLPFAKLALQKLASSLGL